MSLDEFNRFKSQMQRQFNFNGKLQSNKLKDQNYKESTI